jgi:hypothetical protein
MVMIRKTLRAAGAFLTVLAVYALAQAAPLPERDDNKDDAKKPFPLKEMEKRVWHISFPAGQKATITVTSEHEADVDLHVEEMDGTEVVEDIDPSKDAKVEFTPLKQKTYRVSVINVGEGDNKCTLTHTGKIEQPSFGKTTELKPFQVAADGTKEFDVKLKEGQWSAVWVSGAKATDVDVFVFGPDGVEVTNDEHVSKDAFVSFVPKETGTYRIEVRNLGPGENTCTLKHTVMDEEKRDKE